MRFEWVLGWASKVDTYPVPSPRIALCMLNEDHMDILGSRSKIPPLHGPAHPLMLYPLPKHLSHSVAIMGESRYLGVS